MMYNSAKGVVAGIGFLLLLGVLSLSCNSSQTVAGGGTGAGNAAIAGRVIYSDNNPVVGANVRLRPETYVSEAPDTPDGVLRRSVADGTTDASGAFRFDSIDTGTYVIEVVDADGKNGTMFRHYCSTNDIDTLLPRVVSPVVRVSGTVIVHGLPSRALVQVYGTDIACKTDGLGKFELPALPVGKCEENECGYALRVVTLKNGIETVYHYEMEVEWSAAGTRVEIELDSDMEIDD